VDVTCQICAIHGHLASDCWWHFKNDSDDDGGRDNMKGVNVASYGMDSNWYSDSGATDHITSELNKLTTQEKYKGRDRVHMYDGNHMVISHTGYSKLQTPHSTFHLNDILCIPSASKNLLSIHKLCPDNNVFIEFHPWFFLIKYQVT
jgi:hypothetical protein